MIAHTLYRAGHEIGFRVGLKLGAALGRALFHVAGSPGADTLRGRALLRTAGVRR
jgi:hypothetical protein